MRTEWKRRLAGLAAAAVCAALPTASVRADGLQAPWFQVSVPVQSASGFGYFEPVTLTYGCLPFWQYVEGFRWAQYNQERLAQSGDLPIYVARSATPLPGLPSYPQVVYGGAPVVPVQVSPVPAPAAPAPAPSPAHGTSDKLPGRPPAPATLPDQPALPPDDPAPPARDETPPATPGGEKQPPAAEPGSGKPGDEPTGGASGQPAGGEPAAREPGQTPGAAPAEGQPGQSGPVGHPSQSGPAGQSGQAPAPSGLTPDEQQLVSLVNAERAKAGLPALAVDARLVKTARAKSQDMITDSYFGHDSPRLGSPFDQMKAAGIAYTAAGENIAGNPSVQGAFVSLMNSPGHRANILNPQYTKIGIGIVQGGPYGLMVTQQFIGD